ncbi:unnamed protein product, partial [Acidithrix sp. C25]
VHGSRTVPGAIHHRPSWFDGLKISTVFLSHKHKYTLSRAYGSIRCLLSHGCLSEEFRFDVFQAKSVLIHHNRLGAVA